AHDGGGWLLGIAIGNGGGGGDGSVGGKSAGCGEVRGAFEQRKADGGGYVSRAVVVADLRDRDGGGEPDDAIETGEGIEGVGVRSDGDTARGARFDLAPAGILGDAGGNRVRGAEHYFLVGTFLPESCSGENFCDGTGGDPMKEEASISIWFFVGIALAVNGALILGA